MAVSYTAAGDVFTAQRPRPWAPVRFSQLGRGYDVHPDGNRLVVPPVDQSSGPEKLDHVVLIFNFFNDLLRTAR
jgi:hypothetical protein